MLEYTQSVALNLPWGKLTNRLVNLLRSKLALRSWSEGRESG